VKDAERDAEGKIHEVKDAEQDAPQGACG